MNKELLDLIIKLSNSDKKSLCQKALKATEELGELARKVLPFEDAFACKHRFVDRSSILEEVADVILTVQSIAFDLGFSYEDIEDMIKHKALYWGEIQARDTGAKFPVPFEIHVTVSESSLEPFKKVCADVGVKPILIDLQGKDGESVMKDLMTSSVHVGTNASAYAEMKRISDGMKAAGLAVIREKIETVPWHPAAPSQKHSRQTMPPNCYFECHFAVIATEQTLPELTRLASLLDCHISRNIFKRISTDEFKIMLTFRRYHGVYEDFQGWVATIKKQLEGQFAVDKTIVEFSVFDTKISHDAEWLK